MVRIRGSSNYSVLCTLVVPYDVLNRYIYFYVPVQYVVRRIELHTVRVQYTCTVVPLLVYTGIGYVVYRYLYRVPVYVRSVRYLYSV